MALIQVTWKTLRDTAQQLRQLNNRLKTQINDLAQQENSLHSAWQGEANDAFHNAFNNDKVQFENFYDLMERYIQTMENAATEYENKERMNVAIASERKYK